MASTLFAQPIITARLYSGVNAASILAGLTALAGEDFGTLADLSQEKFPQVKGSLALAKTSVHGIAGVSLTMDLPAEGHVHRNVADIEEFYAASRLTPQGRELAHDIWQVIAGAEARVHGADPREVHFHEVGRLANLMAIGLIGEVFAALNPSAFVVGPVPLADGVIRCAHGLVPSPAPAMLAMLDGVTVAPFAGLGEPVTPTGLGILLGLDAQFGAWPAMRVEKHATSFAPGKVFEDAPNGIVWALGYEA